MAFFIFFLFLHYFHYFAQRTKIIVTHKTKKDIIIFLTGMKITKKKDKQIMKIAISLVLWILSL